MRFLVSKGMRVVWNFSPFTDTTSLGRERPGIASNRHRHSTGPSYYADHPNHSTEHPDHLGEQPCSFAASGNATPAMPPQGAADCIRQRCELGAAHRLPEARRSLAPSARRVATADGIRRSLRLRSSIERPTSGIQALCRPSPPLPSLPHPTPTKKVFRLRYCTE